MPTTNDTTLPMPAGPPLPLYAQVPPGARRGVVVLHEIFGRQPEIDRVVDRLAAAGFAAVAPDLFHGQDKLTCLRQTMATMQTGQGPFVERIRAARKWLCEQANLPEGAVGLIGFCLGGGFALAAGSGWGAVSSNYGEIPPAEVMRGIGPVIACYGGRDVLFRNNADKLRRRLERVGVVPEVHVYPEVGHSFLTDGHHPVAATLSRPLMHITWNPEVAEAAWRQILAFLTEHLPPG